MARLQLVEGLGATEAGRRVGKAHSTARSAAERVIRELCKEGGYPPDWRAVTVMVPPDVAAVIHELAAAAHKADGLAV